MRELNRDEIDTVSGGLRSFFDYPGFFQDSGGAAFVGVISSPVSIGRIFSSVPSPRNGPDTSGVVSVGGRRGGYTFGAETAPTDPRLENPLPR